MDAFEAQSGELAEVAWTTVSVSGREAINELYAFDVVIAADDEALGSRDDTRVEELLLSQSAMLQLGEHGVRRGGIITAAHALLLRSPARPHERAFRVTLRPRAWLLTQRRNTRIFYGLYLHHIVALVLHEHGVRCSWTLENTYPVRLYCTQYEETDHDFICRLLAEEGVMFFFEHRDAFADAGVPEPGSPEESDREKWGGYLDKAGGLVGGALGQAMKLVGDWVGDVDPEKAEPMVPGTGEAGDVIASGVHDVFRFVDRASGYRLADPPLALAVGEPAGLTHEASVFWLRSGQEVRPRQLHIRDYDFHRPMLELSARAGEAPAPTDAAERPRTGLEIYEHHGEYQSVDIDQEGADVRLEQYRAQALLWRGEADSGNLLPGHRATLDLSRYGADGGSPPTNIAFVSATYESFHPGYAPPASNLDAVARGCARAIHAALTGGALHEQELATIIHEAASTSDDEQRRLRARFQCLPEEAVMRPARPRRRMRNVCETATVVGPKDTQIHTEEHGRVRVKFHWDRSTHVYGENSCWIRVAQPWAGTGFGHQFIPRVGMEVLVAFLGGDPDRPVVVGSLYNQTHPTPEPLPDRKTRSVIRSESVPEGGGFNEISFDDARGLERIYIHAEKDLVHQVGDSHSVSIGKNHELQVLQRQRLAVGHDQVVGVGGNQATQVGGDQGAFVRGNRHSRVARHALDMVDGNAIAEVRGLRIEGTQRDQLTQIDGDSSLSIGGSSITQIGGRDTESSDAVTYVQGSWFVTATDGVVLRAEAPDGTADTSCVRIVCGKSSVELTHDTITLNAPNIVARASESMSLSGGQGRVLLDQTGVSITGPCVRSRATPGATLVLDAVARLQAAAISLCQPEQEETEQAAEQGKQTGRTIDLILSHLELGTDTAMLDGVRARVVAAGVVMEKTVHCGRVSVELPPEAESLLLTVFVDEHETLKQLYGAPLTWHLKLVGAIPPPDCPQGVRYLLRNLGYDTGGDMDETELDDLTRQALTSFQRQWRLKPSGELDDETKAALQRAASAQAPTSVPEMSA